MSKLFFYDIKRQNSPILTEPKLKKPSDKVIRISADQKRSQQENILNKIEEQYGPLEKKIKWADLNGSDFERDEITNDNDGKIMKDCS